MKILRRRQAPSEDPRWLQRLKQGDPVAFRNLIEEHQGVVYQICLRFMGNDAEAEDMAQETFIRASQALKNFRGDASLKTWLYSLRG